MSRIDNLGDDSAQIRALLKRVAALEKATPLGTSSMGRGQLRLYGGAQLVIEDGNLTVSGTATVSGELTGGGTFEWTGPVTLTGTTDLNGPVNIAGALKVTGTTEIDGATTLKDDLTVVTGGGITIDSSNPLKLSPSGSHAIEWQSGAYLLSNDGGVGIGPSGYGAALQANVDGSAALFYASGAIAVWTTDTGIILYSPDGTKTMQLTNSGLVGP